MDLREYVLNKYSKELLGNNYFAVFDTETTGFSVARNDLISLSCEVRDLEFDKKDEITLYAKPRSPKNWSKKSEEIHGFTIEQALDFADPKKTAIDLLKFLVPFKHQRNHPLLFVSHDNNGFDYRFLECFYRLDDLQFSFWKVFAKDYRCSTIQLAKKAGYTDNKLNKWAQRINMELNHHEVESDRKVCAEVFKFLMESMNEMDFNK